MRFSILVGLAITLSTALGQENAVKENAVKEELKKLDGKWAQVSVEADGRKGDDTDSPKVTLTITGNKWIERSVAVADDGGFYTFKINPAKMPREIDLIEKVDDQGKTFTYPAIYRLEGATLTVAVPFPFEGNLANIDKRPTGFQTKPGADFVVIVYKRVK
jgi:uncharacterized protein (TIGR03067 family)